MSQIVTRAQIYIQPELLVQNVIAAKNKGIYLSQLIREFVEEGVKTKYKKPKIFADLKTLTLPNPIECKELWDLSKKLMKSCMTSKIITDSDFLATIDSISRVSPFSRIRSQEQKQAKRKTGELRLIDRFANRMLSKE